MSKIRVYSIRSYPLFTVVNIQKRHYRFKILCPSRSPPRYRQPWSRLLARRTGRNSSSLSRKWLLEYMAAPSFEMIDFPSQNPNWKIIYFIFWQELTVNHLFLLISWIPFLPFPRRSDGNSFAKFLIICEAERLILSTGKGNDSRPFKAILEYF